MTLQNLARAGRLHAHETSAGEVRSLLDAARRNLLDAARRQNSPETRFDCAYKAVMQAALVAMLANGYRPSTSAPGHHQTIIQSLPLTAGLDPDAWVPLDVLRRKRNQADYTGAPASEAEVLDAIGQAEALLATVVGYLHRRRPDLLSSDRLQ
jgi:hypothetical protein